MVYMRSPPEEPHLAYGVVPSFVKLRKGSARDGPQGERPQSLKPCLELTLKLVVSELAGVNWLWPSYIFQTVWNVIFVQYYQLKHGFHENIRDILFAKIGLLCWLGWETVISTIQTPAKIVFAEWVQLAASCGTLYCFIALTKRTFKYCKYCTSFKQSRRTHTSKMGVKRILSNRSVTLSHYGIAYQLCLLFSKFPL